MVWVPDPQPISPLRRVSPSRFSFLSKCSLREIRADNGNPPLLPLYPSAHIGTVIHALLEKAVNGAIKDEALFKEEWDTKVNEVEEKLSTSWLDQHLVPLSKSVRLYEVKKRFCFKLLSKNMLSQGARRTGTSLAERWYETADGMVGGFIDKVERTPAGDVVLDYKTGEVLEEIPGIPTLAIKDEYSTQLKLYAALYHNKHRKWPSRLVLVGLDGIYHQIQFTPEECLDLLNRARLLYLKLNDLIDDLSGDQEQLQARLSKPNPENCFFCLYRPSCLPYWEARNSDPEEEWPNDVRGTIIKKQQLGNGLLLIKIDIGHSVVMLRGLHPTRHIALDFDNSQRQVLAFNLTPDSTPVSYKENLLTTIYSLSL